MNWRKTGFVFLSACLLLLSVAGAVRFDRPVPVAEPGESSSFRPKQLPHQDPEKIQQPVFTGLQLLQHKKSGSGSLEISLRIPGTHRGVDPSPGQILPYGLKSYLLHNYPSHNFW